MALTEEQVKELKRQLTQQIQHLPKDQREGAQQQIDAMNSDELESMLKMQMQQQKGAKGASGEPQQVFRHIVSGEIPSKKIQESKDAIAVLDIKPISKGHVVIIPKKAVTKSFSLPPSIFELAQEIAGRATEKLKATGTEIQTEFKFGEIIINVIPVYDQSVNLMSPRNDAKDEELQEVYRELKQEKKPEVVKIKKEKPEVFKLKRKIP